MEVKLRMEPVYKDDLLSIAHARSESLLTVTWSDSCDNLIENSKGALKTMNDTIKVFNPKFLLIDFQKCTYFLSPGNNDWEENLLVRKIRADHASKIAIVVPGNLFAFPVFEATRTSMERALGNVMFYGNHGQALSWLLM